MKLHKSALRIIERIKSEKYLSHRAFVNKKSYEKNREKYIARSSAYYYANKEKYKENSRDRVREYYQKNKLALNMYGDFCRLAFPEYLREYERKNRLTINKNKRFNRYRRNFPPEVEPLLDLQYEFRKEIINQNLQRRRK